MAAVPLAATAARASSPAAADDDEDDDEPAQAGPDASRPAPIGPERLDRRDPPGAIGRLQRPRRASRSMPTATARTTAAGGTVRPSIGTTPADPRYQATSAASPAPTTTPSAEPTSPIDERLAEDEPVTWRRVAPAARSRPTSRTRSTTVIESVLKMRNAPANRAIAAMSAVVAWKSTVEARSEAARSSGVERTYGSPVSRSWSATATADDVAPSPTPTSTRRHGRRSRTGGRPRRDRRSTVRPSVAGQRPVAGQDPDDPARSAAAGAAAG